jgi:cytoskeleton protein RodZ
MVILLLVAAVVIVFLPDMGRSSEAPEVVGAQTPPQPAETQPRLPVTEVTETTANIVNVPQITGPVVVTSAPATPAPVEVLKPAPAAAVPVAKTTATPMDVDGRNAGPIVVGFKVRGPSWVEVTDSKGTVQLRKTMAAGEYVSASGSLPLTVVVGRADVTDVEVRGKAFSLAGLSKDNVARFEVK